MQRKLTKWSLIFVAVLIPAIIIFGVLMERRVSTKLESAGSEETPDWYDVDQSVRRGDFNKAILIGEKLIVKTPLYPEAHRRLAGAYLAAGDLEKARQHYAEAFRLFPSEENEKSLAAIDRRLKSENPQAGAGNSHRAGQ
jgi:tetratricopeptide (TPR) repeat protein